MSQLAPVVNDDFSLPMPKPIADMTVEELEIAAYAYELGQADYRDTDQGEKPQQAHGDPLYLPDYSWNPYIIEEVTHE